MLEPVLYVVDRIADDPSGTAAMLQTVSHLTLLVAVIYCFRAQAWLAAAYSLGSLLTSLAYHVCKLDLFCLGHLELDQWRRLDHFCSLLLGAGLLIEVLRTAARTRVQRAVLRFGTYFLPIVVKWAVEFHPYQLRSAFNVITYVVLLAVATHFQDPPRASYYQARDLLLGALLLAGGSVFYILDSGEPRQDTFIDALYHALWHLLSGLSIVLIVKGSRKDQSL